MTFNIATQQFLNFHKLADFYMKLGNGEFFRWLAANLWFETQHGCQNEKN